MKTRTRARRVGQLLNYFCGTLGFAAVAAEPTGAVVRSEFIYDKAPFPSCHASTIVEPRAGGLVAAWFGGTAEGKPDVEIWLSRFDGDSWSAPISVADDKRSDGSRGPTWNPVLFEPKDGPLWLYFKTGDSPSRWSGSRKFSTDAGKTWSAAERLPDGILGPVKNKPVQLADGSLLSASSSEHDGWRVHFERSTDGGKSWTLIGPVNDGKKISAIQPSILLHGGDSLQAVGRTRQGKIFEVWSTDAGRTWGELTLTDLPNPNSGTDAVTLRDGRHLLVYNPVTKGRTPLAIAITADGKTWTPNFQSLETEPGEYSYPAIIQSRAGLVHVTYTWKRQRIKHVVLDPSRF